MAEEVDEEAAVAIVAEPENISVGESGFVSQAPTTCSVQIENEDDWRQNCFEDHDALHLPPKEAKEAKEMKEGKEDHDAINLPPCPEQRSSQQYSFSVLDHHQESEPFLGKGVNKISRKTTFGEVAFSSFNTAVTYY